MKKKVVGWILILLWCGFIFYQSGKPGFESSKESSFVLDIINNFIKMVTGTSRFLFPEILIRKTAHHIEYFILGFFLFYGFYNKEKLKRASGLAFLMGVLYAVTDEIHQYFIPGRAMRVLDVMIDSTGLLLAISILYFYKKRKNTMLGSGRQGII